MIMRTRSSISSCPMRVTLRCRAARWLIGARPRAASLRKETTAWSARGKSLPTHRGKLRTHGSGSSPAGSGRARPH
eukprot:11218561-Alexandrium_andersonii.AAC.1